MLGSVKNAILSAPSTIYRGASSAIKKAGGHLGKFHENKIKPRFDSLKSDFDRMRKDLSEKFRASKDTPLEERSSAVAPKTFQQELNELEGRLKSQDDHTSLMQDIAGLAGKAKTMEDVADSVLLLDYCLGDGKERDLEAFRVALSSLPFLKVKDKMGDALAQLEGELNTKGRSCESLQPPLKRLFNAMVEFSELESNIQWMKANITTPSKAPPHLNAQLLAMQELQRGKGALFQIAEHKNQQLEVPELFKNKLFKELNAIEEKIKILEDLANTEDIHIKADPLIAMAGPFLKDFQAFKAEAAKVLDCSVDELSVQVKDQLKADLQGSYVKRMHERLGSGDMQRFLLMALEDKDEAAVKQKIIERLNPTNKSVLISPLRNPFSEDGLAPVRFGTNPGELELKINNADSKNIKLEFTVHLLDENQNPKKDTFNLSLRKEKEKKDLTATKVSLAEKAAYKDEEKLKELALLQIAKSKLSKEDFEEFDSEYESLKNNFINKEMEAILAAKLPEDKKPATGEKIQFNDQPQDLTPSPIETPKNEARDNEALYTAAKKEATDKVEAELQAYIADNQKALNSEYAKRAPTASSNNQ